MYTQVRPKQRNAVNFSEECRDSGDEREICGNCFLQVVFSFKCNHSTNGSEMYLKSLFEIRLFAYNA